MSYPTPVRPTPRRIWPILAGMAVLGMLLCGGLALAVSVSEPREGVLPTVTPDPGTRPTLEPSPVKGQGAGARIGPGMWKVGTEVKPGEYRTTGMSEDSVLCYWHSAKDTGTEHIIEQGTAASRNEPGRITLKSGQYFQTSGCADWVRQ